MSGRDLRSFLAQHRGGTFHVPRKNVSGELTGKYVCGARRGHEGLRTTDYDDLLKKARTHKEVGVAQWRHMEGLSQRSVCRKEAGLQSIHREAWNRELQKLRQDRGVAEAALEEWQRESRTSNGSSDAGSGLWAELVECEAEIASEKRHFERVMDKVRDITVNLKNWVRTREKAESDQRGMGHRMWLEERLTHVKAEMASSWRQLNEGYQSLTDQLTDALSRHGGVAGVEPGESRSRGKEEEAGVHLACGWEECGEGEVSVAMEVYDTGSFPEALLYCSSEALCSSLTEELAAMDVHYRDKLQHLQERHQAAISCLHGGWSPDDSYKFQVVMARYPEGVKGRSKRELYLDWLAREFPGLSRQKLVEHEKWVWSVQAYRKQRLTCLRDWSNQRNGLLVRITNAVDEYEEQKAHKEAELCCRENQLELCRVLHEKVKAWREEKLLLSQKEAELAVVMEMEKEAILRVERERKREREARTKGRIKAYRQRREVELEEEWLVAEKLRLVAEEEKKMISGRDQERVELRKQMLLEKLSKQREKREEVEEARRERERQLDRLREQVAVEATSDPDRLVQHTCATKARLESKEETLARPCLHGYTDHQVTSDPRLRLETALREVGLLQSNYARYMLSRAPPPSNPRPDQQSSIFKQ